MVIAVITIWLIIEKSKFGIIIAGKPSGIEPTIAPPRPPSATGEPKLIAQEIIVVTTTANKTPGNFGAYFLTPIIMAKATIAANKVQLFVN